MLVTRCSILVVFLSLLCTVANAQQPLAWWRFDESSGSTATDSVGTFNGILAGGANFVSGGISGNAISIARASNALVNMGTSFPGFVGSDFTLISWIKTTDTQLSIFAGKHASGTGNGYYTAINSGGPTSYGEQNKAYAYTGGFPFESPISTSVVNDGSWHQVVTMRNGLSTQIWVDGQMQSSLISPGLSSNNAAFIIGGVDFGGVATSYYDGLVDEVQVYGSALTSSQILTLYNNPGTIVNASAPEPGSLAFFVMGSVMYHVRRRIRSRGKNTNA